MKYIMAFYGGSVVPSQLPKLQKPLTDCIATIAKDIKEVLPKLSKSELDKAVLDALKAMHNLGAEHPNIHRSGSTIYIRACQLAIVSAREAVVRSEKVREEQEESEESAERIADRNKVAGEIYVLYNELKAECFENDTEFPAVDAYVILLRVKNLDLSGYGNWMLFWRIPQDNEIWDHPKVIEACSNHPQLPNRGPTKMRINNEKPYSFI